MRGRGSAGCPAGRCGCQGLCALAAPAGRSAARQRGLLGSGAQFHPAGLVAAGGWQASTGILLLVGVTRRPRAPAGAPPLAGEIHEFKQDLNTLDRSKKKEAVKRIIAAMTVGKDVSSLFPGAAARGGAGRGGGASGGGATGAPARPPERGASLGLVHN